MTAGDILYQPSEDRVAQAAMTVFRRKAARIAGRDLADSSALHAWSVEEPALFWRTFTEFSGLKAELGDVDQWDAPEFWRRRFFPEGHLSFVGNMLRRADDEVGLIATDETHILRTLTMKTIKEETAAMAAALKAGGVDEGDVVAGILPNREEAVIALLATASLGAVWTCCSPDFGVPALLQRFQQVAPKVLFVCDGYRITGRAVSLKETADAVIAGLESLKLVVRVGVLAEDESETGWTQLIERERGAELDLSPRPFDHPLCIVYSSGTTGAPKSIIHGAGGTLLQHAKEHQLHVDVKPDDRMLFFTSAAWMMWNWLISTMASEAIPVLYDGNPSYPSKESFFSLATQVGATHFGASAKFYDMARQRDLPISELTDFSQVRCLMSTGSPLSPDNFDYIYRQVAPQCHLASISGGSDILSCFILGDPTAPVHRGELQMPGLGMDVDVAGQDGTPLVGTPGELVCRAPFPSMPVAFANDPDDAKFRRAYFEGFDGIWTHGDRAERTSRGSFIISGRSDATLNPGGIRIGTGEIYAAVEALPEVAEAMAAALPTRDDEQVVLFTRLTDGAELDRELVSKIKRKLRHDLSQAHVPSHIVAVADLPRTRNGKLAEIAAKKILGGNDPDNDDALENPRALDVIRDFASQHGVTNTIRSERAVP